MIQTTTANAKTQTTTTKGALQLKEISIIPITPPATSASAAINATSTTVNQQQPSGSNQSSMVAAADDDSDSLRKKRCTDRYDSSESSDR